MKIGDKYLTALTSCSGFWRIQCPIQGSALIRAAFHDHIPCSHWKGLTPTLTKLLTVKNCVKLPGKSRA
jgi:hypothetical protein